MRRVLNMVSVALLAVMLVACDKEPIYNGDDAQTDIEIDMGNYITFQTEANTRASLVESNYLTESFGVYGYLYDFGKSWTGQRTVALPEVFWNGTNASRLPLKVTESGGYYTYNATNAEAEDAGQINWTGNKYAFFAYYPYEHSSMVRSSMTAAGAPYMIYTVDKSNAKNHIDLMTGGASEVTAASNHNTVTFSMAHRLSGVDVSICNAYVHSYTVSEVNYESDVDIEISYLELDFENVKYDKAKIFLEKNKYVPMLNTVPENISGTQTANFVLIGPSSNSGLTTYSIAPSDNANTIVTVDTETSMTFIPQEFDPNDATDKDVEVTATIIYRMKNKATGEYVIKPKVNDEGDFVDALGNVIPLDGEGNPTAELYYEGYEDRPFSVTKVSNFNQALVEGSRYYVVLTFTSDAVSINIITAAAWDDKEIDYEFM